MATSANVNTIIDTLLEWHKNNKRDFHWRKNKSPFRILVSEVLLQQTFAEKVNPVFRKVVRNYPDFDSLQEADPLELEKIIKPLGLLYRAELLIEIASVVKKNFNGRLPSKKEDLLNIKGIGDYIADAILCHAYSKPVIPSDTNSDRVICRLYGLKYPVKGAENRDKVNNIVSSFNQEATKHENLHYAILDFAGIKCKFYNPQIDDCPLRKICCFSNGETESNS